MPEYEYKGIPLTPTVASWHILEYLHQQLIPVRRREIAKYVADQHENSGGKVEGDPSISVKKALSRLGCGKGHPPNSFGLLFFTKRGIGATLRC
jgi:hypothetical protein